MSGWQPDPADLCQHRAGALPAQAGPAHTPGLHAWHRADVPEVRPRGIRAPYAESSYTVNMSDSGSIDTGDAVDSPARPREISVAEPEWRRVAAEIRQRIRVGQIRTDAEGVRWLPTYDELQEQHATSYGTLRTVLIALEAEGWIIRRPGVGLQVREDHPA